MPKPHRLPNSNQQTLLEGAQVSLVSPKQRPRWDQLVRRHHYLKNANLVGEQLRYVVTDANGKWLALLGWSAAALHLKARDQSIEWSEEQRERRLHFLAQNSRFVILVKPQQLPNLASRAMSLCLKRLSADWQAQYGHPILLIESFVDRQLFRATAYKACGWQALGYSSGFKRVAEDFYQRHNRPKQLWVKELVPRAWQWLRAKQLPAHLAPYEKATPPACATKTEQMPSLFERCDQMKDWRQPIGKRHKLSTVIAITALACLAGVGQGYRAVSRFSKRLSKLQRRALHCWIHPDTAKSQVPSEAVFQRVLHVVPRTQIEKIALQWQNDLLGPVPATDAVVIDGKAVRGGDVMLVNAIAQPSQRLLAVEPVHKKTNEIPTARTLIKRLDLQGKLVQMDGIHTQHETVQQILYEKGGDYIAILRDNQPTLLKTAQQLLPADLPPCTGEDPLPGRAQGVSGDCHPSH
jgi:hypothetical protein